MNYLKTLDNNTTVSFTDFLRLRRQIHELADRARLEKEAEVIRKTGYSRDEVGEFRSLFNGAGGGGGSVKELFSFHDLIVTMRGSIPLGEKIGKELKAIYDETLPPGAVRDLDFPEFLLLMHRILEID